MPKPGSGELQIHGGWTRHTYGSGASGLTFTARSIGTAKPLISCCLNAVPVAARRFFKQAIGTNGVPDRVVIDKSGANLAGLTAVNVILKFTGTGRLVTIRQDKYLNNIMEQDHRFIKRITGPMLGFKAFHSAAATIAGIEVAHMIRKKQFADQGIAAFQKFAALAA